MSHHGRSDIGCGKRAWRAAWKPVLDGPALRMVSPCGHAQPAHCHIREIQFTQGSISNKTWRSNIWPLYSPSQPRAAGDCVRPLPPSGDRPALFDAQHTMDGQNTQPAGHPQQQPQQQQLHDAPPSNPGTPPAASRQQALQEHTIEEEPRPRRATPPPPTPPPHDPPRSRVASSQSASLSVAQGTPQGPQINVYPHTPSPQFVPSPRPQPVSTHPFPVNASLPAAAASRQSGSRHSSGAARRSVGPMGEGVMIPHLSRSPSPILVAPAVLDDAYSVVSNHTHPGTSARPAVAIATQDRPHTIAGYGPQATLSPTSQMPGAYDPPPGVPPVRGASMNMYAQGLENGSGYGAGVPVGAEMPRRPSRTVTRGRTQRSMTHSILDHNVPVLVEEDASTAGVSTRRVFRWSARRSSESMMRCPDGRSSGSHVGP